MYIGKTLIKLKNGSTKDVMTIGIERHIYVTTKICNKNIQIRKIMPAIKLTRQFCDLYHRPKVTSMYQHDLLLKYQKNVKSSSTKSP